jgi:hypothetical protein
VQAWAALVSALALAGAGFWAAETYFTTAQKNQADTRIEAQRPFLDEQLKTDKYLVAVMTTLADQYDGTKPPRPLRTMPAWREFETLWYGQLAMFEDGNVYLAIKAFRNMADRADIPPNALRRETRLIAEAARRALKRRWDVAPTIELDEADTYFVTYPEAVDTCNRRNAVRSRPAAISGATGTYQTGWLDFEDVRPGNNVVYQLDDDTAKRVAPLRASHLGAFVCDVADDPYRHHWTWQPKGVLPPPPLSTLRPIGD